MQTKLADALEDFAFLLVIESPLAAESPWVFYETNYALSHSMGLTIITLPGASEIPGTHDLPRVSLKEEDVFEEGNFTLLTPEGLAKVAKVVEDAHARSLVRRRQNLVVNVQEAVGASGKKCTQFTQWSLLIHDDPPTLVGVSPRLPDTDDLFRLHSLAARDVNSECKSVLVHSARTLTPSRKEILRWATGGRPISLVPENAIGAYWQPC